MSRSPWIVLPLVLAFSCDDGSVPEAAAAQGVGQAEAPTVQANLLRFEVWHDDFPFAVHLSPLAEGDAYHYSAREALERVVGKLMGNCTPAGWHMAMQFFERAPESAIPLLIQSMDQAMQVHHLSDLVQNTAEAMGHMGRFGSPEIAEALLRALQHGKKSVQNSAMAALVQAGTPETVREAARFVPNLHVRGQAEWIRAVRRHLPEEEIESIYLEALHSETMASVFGIAVEESEKLPVELGARILGSLWEEARGTLKLTVASTLHAAGDLRGTRFLREVLERGDGEGVAVAVVGAARGDLKYLRDDILKLSLSPTATVRQSVALTIGDWPGENVDRVLATLAVDPVDAVRHTALTMLRGREQRGLLDDLIQRVRTATGSKLIQALGDLSAAGDGQAAGPILERMRGAPREEWRKYIQALGLSRTEEGFAALREVFLEPEAPVDYGSDRTNVTYVGVVLANVQAARDQILTLFGELPRDDYRRRGCLLSTLGDMAAVSEDGAFRKATYDLCRAILADSEEIPQMRFLALQYLRPDLSLDDMKAVKKLHTNERGPMRRALSDFLYEFF